MKLLKAMLGGGFFRRDFGEEKGVGIEKKMTK